MTGCHVIAERGVWGPVPRASEMFVKAETNTSFCFPDVCVPRLPLFTELTDNLIYNISNVTPAAQTTEACRTFTAPTRAGGWVLSRSDQTLL